MTEIVKMSVKGQLVVPQDIREQLSINPGDHFVAVPVDDGVVFKRVHLEKEFSRIAKEIEHRFSKKDVQEATAWAKKR